MNTDNLIRIEYFCEQYNVEFSFINALKESGLINLVVVEESSYLSTEDLKGLEKLIRLHYELGINLEGIDVISNLLNQLEDLQQELTAAKNKLKFLGME
ncbi:MAG TPA: chaperone modulator CbpM [Cyclobacteriaceae bacterium]|nr:chaperone modulator CbpM [Cyclobacteriaceae bacterium]HPW63258.1 chaperone modulator CbpM [Cyclobacteriaceae bacterium]